MSAVAHENVQDFLDVARSALESSEAANSLMLGLCGQILQHPGWTSACPCLMTVADGYRLTGAAIMTPPFKLIVVGFRGALAHSADGLVTALAQGRWNVPGVLGPADAAAAVANAWLRAGRGRPQLARTQRVYALREVRTHAAAPGRLRLASIRDLDLLARWRYQFTLGIHGTANRGQSDRIMLERIENRDVYLWEDGRPVSMAMKTRPTRRGITVSYVYTPPGSRGRGYATSCVSELSRVLLGAGWEFCALFADVDNPIAIHIYDKIGYRRVCEYLEYDFPVVPPGKLTKDDGRRANGSEELVAPGGPEGERPRPC
jgi:GNAT superfamily N-acetyltransferase